MARSEKVEFTGALDEKLAARLDLPAGEPRAYALFAHCFTCSKDVFAAARVSSELARHGIGVLRFDFTGLGSSDGDFANTNFTSNTKDLIAAADWLRENRKAPAILIGHSLGGAAVLAAAGEIDEADAVATIAAPSDPGHIAHHFSESADEIREKGEAEVTIAGRSFRVQKQLLDDIEKTKLTDKVKNLKKALLVFHGPRDEIVGIDNATDIFVAAKHPKSFVSLDTADHLLSERADAIYVADVLAAWASRYVGAQPDRPREPKVEEGEWIVYETGEGKFAQIATDSNHSLRADEPESIGGANSGPTPYGLLTAALGACTSMTLRLYADKKKIPLDWVGVRLSHEKIHAKDCEDCEQSDGKIDRIEREIEIRGQDITDEQRERLLEIADRCPVHQTLERRNEIVTRLRD